MATNLGISMSALRRWVSIADKGNGTVETRGSDNYASEEAKGIAKLKREYCFRKVIDFGWKLVRLS